MPENIVFSSFAFFTVISTFFDLYRITPLQVIFKDTTLCMGAYSNGGLFEGCLKTVRVAGHIPVRTFQLINYFFDAAYTSSRIFFGTGKSSSITK